ncbi:T9SS type A sorting domain-containing protein [Pontibacter fetidus]|uniref:T9SS type A sorting domain-containing protein n=1 Tax=Pontibacter fetidus TaxID=2700082 RepID=A0A6B2H698_9BACT|nr:T9SS type A sorting domain-containing protein [Pontibacter fetidus]NDK56306.1 T9SS type A sorting domain-containing protein [Pontibacter fetidus]
MVGIFTRFTLITFCCLLIVLLFCRDAVAQVSLNPFTKNYTQNFDGLPLSGTGTWAHGTQYFPGWSLFRTAPATSTITAGTGSNNAGGLYSFGPAGSTDRALGSIASATSTVGEFAWGLLIQNNTGQTITALHINFTGEQWRSARPATPQHTLSFWYATGADAAAFNLSPKSDAGWTNVKELDFLGPVFYATGSALDGNATANKRYLTVSIPVTIPDKGYVMLRWKDLDEFENDHGLAIDDFSMTWSTQTTSGPTPLPVELVNFKASTQHQGVVLNWATASEKDNKHFIVERSQNGKSFAGIATIAGKGTSSTRSNYTFTDADPLSGGLYYRLKQIDFDGSYTYSKVVSVKWQSLTSAILYPTITSDILYLDAAEKENTISIVDMAGKQVYQQQFISKTRNYTLDVSKLKTGNYSMLLISGKGERQVLRFVKR